MFSLTFQEFKQEVERVLQVEDAIYSDLSKYNTDALYGAVWENGSGDSYKRYVVEYQPQRSLPYHFCEPEYGKMKYPEGFGSTLTEAVENYRISSEDAAN
jgi:hypothetical protein